MSVMEDPKSNIEGLYAKLPCRKAQIDLLLNLFGQPKDVPCQSIFIFGHSGTGKSTIVASVLQSLEAHHAILNCVECYSPQLLFELILNRVSKTNSSPENGYANFLNCDNLNDFVHLLKRAIELQQADKETIYIVLDKAERLRAMSSNILSVFLRLQELIQMNVCVILISEIVWEKFRIPSGMHEPHSIHFPSYTKDDLCTILTMDCPKNYSLPFYTNYVQLVLSVFFLVCRSLPEIRYLARQNFPKYVDPIVKGDANEGDTAILWKNIEPLLKRSLHSVYLRESLVEKDGAAMTLPSSRLTLELPFYSKFLLIAAYLASYNPAKMDRRFFVKQHDKVGKRAKLSSMKRNMKVSNHLLGPKPFTLDRLLAIFYSIVEEKVEPTARIYSQIASLVSLDLLSQIGRETTLDMPKYKCVVSLDCIRPIARTVDFDIVRYLYDFN